MPRNNSILIILAIVFACSLSFFSRHAQGRQLDLAGLPGWVTLDADSLYHMRRVERSLESNFEVAGRDEFLNYPEGSAIPWPPYYTAIASRIVAPFISDQETERRATIEESVASLGLVFGVLTTLVAVLAGALVAGRLGAFVAGTYHALCHMSIAYSQLGNGDHHSFVSFMGGCLLLLISWLLKADRLRDRRKAVIGGSLSGLLLGVLIGSWLGSMVLLIGIELVLAYLIFRHAKAPLEGLASFGLSLHLVALATLLPAVLASPWTEIQPWMLVNLSYFHPAFLALGALVFVPLFTIEPSSTNMRRYPWIVGSLLACLGALILFTDVAVASAIREGFDWSSKTNRFMAGISESRSLFASDASPTASYTLGYGLWLLPLVLAAGFYVVLRRGLTPILPWLVVGLIAALQSSQQARFAESLVLPLAVLLAWACAQTCNLRGWSKAIAIPVTVLLAGASHWGSTAKTIEYTLRYKPVAQERESASALGALRATRWIAKHTPRTGDYSVLADWSWGHCIEWGAERPSVATNFGSYVGEDSFRDPARFFMAEDPHTAEALLERRRARYVLLQSDLPDHLNSMVERSFPEQRNRWIQSGSEGQVTKAWFQTMGARLMFDGTLFQSPEAAQLDFLRLVYVSPIPDPGRRLRGPDDISPSAWVWEHVLGAQVTRSGLPGETLDVSLQLSFERANRTVEWKGTALANSEGLATLRVPYGTISANGDGQAIRASWRMGNAQGSLSIGEQAVQSGLVVSLPSGN